MKRFNVREGVRGLYLHRQLLKSVVVRDIQTRYRGTVLGSLWAVIYPLMMLSVYAFVFGGVFKTRWTAQGNLTDFVLMLYCGLIVHALFSETLTRSPTAVLSKPNYVKKVVFPLELLPISDLASALFNAVVGLGMLCFFILLQKQTISPTALLAPLVFAPLLLMTAGLAWFLAAIGVFFRDIGQVIGIIMSILLFLSPIFYPASSAPLLAQKLIYMNPLTYPIEELRQVLIRGLSPNWIHWVLYTSVSLLIAVFGLWVFQRTRPAFADVV